MKADTPQNKGDSANASCLDYERLPTSLYSKLRTATVARPEVFAFNDALSTSLGLDDAWIDQPENIATLTGQRTLAGGEPLAMAYSGHQFGYYSPLLGDGRAVLVGELADADGAIVDVHLKGSGLTPYSRGGDGKATLGAVVREYLISEAMAGLAIPTTRSLAILITGETVPREHLHPGAILARTAHSHLRVGTFQYAASLDDKSVIKDLTDYTIVRLYPDIDLSSPKRFEVLLRAVARKQADLIAKWMMAGFVHGVMNTDNMTISGETIDYGPCAFMDRFNSSTVFSSIDQNSRYAWNRQPDAAQWNLARLSETLLPFLADTEDTQIETAQRILSEFVADFQSKFFTGFAEKLGIDSNKSEMESFVRKTFTALTEGGVDFTQFFTALTRHAEGESVKSIRDLFLDKDNANNWYTDWQSMSGGPEALSSDQKLLMRKLNPVRIPRNHQVDRAIRLSEAGDRSAFDSLLSSLESPYDEDSRFIEYETPPTPEEEIRQTFCGT